MFSERTRRQRSLWTHPRLQILSISCKLLNYHSRSLTHLSLSNNNHITLFLIPSRPKVSLQHIFMAWLMETLCLCGLKRICLDEKMSICERLSFKLMSLWISNCCRHHVVHYEGQGGAVQTSSKPRPDVLALIGRAADSLRPDVQHLLSHLKTDPSSSIYAAAHQNTAKTSTTWKQNTQIMEAES